MKVAVTGGRGRLAPLVVNAFRERGAEVIVYSREAGPGFSAMEEFSAPDVLVHCAWSSVPFTAEANPANSESIDLPLLKSVIEQTHDANSLIIFPSSGAVYGNTGEAPADELSPIKPLGAYARGKIAAENLLLEQAAERSLVLRTTNLLGDSNDPTRPQGVLPKLVSAAKEGTEFPLWGDGTSTKDYIHTSDFLEAVFSLRQSEQRGVFNVGSGTSTSLLDIIALVEQLTGHRIKIRKFPHFDWDVSCSRISVEKLRSIGWQPRVSLRDAISRCLT